MAHGLRSIIASAFGATRADGSRSTRGCVNWPVSVQDMIRRRALRSLTASPSRPSRAGRAGTTEARKVSGRKRHLLVDTLGLLKVVAHPTNLHDRLGAKLVPDSLSNDFPRLRHIWADQGYAPALRQWTAERLGIELEVVYP